MGKKEAIATTFCSLIFGSSSIIDWDEFKTANEDKGMITAIEIIAILV